MLEAIRTFVFQRILRSGAGAAPSGAVPSGPAGPDEVQLAACALLLELAHADGEFSAEEQARLEEALGSRFGLDEATARELLALAETERRQSIDHFQFTRLLGEHYDFGQKMALAEIMWWLILADDRVGDHEAYLMRKLAALLGLQPADLAAARRAAARRLEQP